jgi:hypothetical protein
MPDQPLVLGNNPMVGTTVFPSWSSISNIPLYKSDILINALIPFTFALAHAYNKSKLSKGSVYEYLML